MSLIRKINFPLCDIDKDRYVIGKSNPLDETQDIQQYSAWNCSAL